MFFFNSCQKEVENSLPDIDRSSNGIQSRSSTSFSSIVENKIIVLGNKIENPYAIRNLEAASISLYGNSGTFAVTDRYIKFTPSDLQELKELYELDLDFSDYPLDKEVLQEGKIIKEYTYLEMPALYAYVPIEMDISAFQFHVEDDLSFNISDIEIFRESMILTGNEGEIAAFGDIDPNPPISCTFPCYPFYDPTSPYANQDGWLCKCLPTTVGGGGNLNGCGCPIPNYPAYPAGCVQVEDTQLGNVGVQGVEVKWDNGWGKTIKTFTDENGCFEIKSGDPYNPYEAHGNEYVTVKFKNENATIRSIWPEYPLFLYSQAVEDKRKVTDNYNNVPIVYSDPLVTNGTATQKVLYIAAMMNNSVFLFNEFCLANSLPILPEDLDMLLTPFASGAAAPMLDDIGNDVRDAIMAFSACGIVTALLTGEAVSTIGMGSLCAYLSVFSPDIVDNYGGEMPQAADGVHNSDLKMNTYFHELAHALHFTENGSDTYWQQNIFYIITNTVTLNNSPYGNRGDNGHECCAVIEAWGSHIGFSAADNRYGNLSSWNFDGIFWLGDRHISRLENYRPDLLTVDLGFEDMGDDDNSWIPSGLFHDCIDDIFFLGFVDQLNDQVTDYDHGMILNSIINSPQSIGDVEQEMISNLPTGQNVNNVILLFDEYGY